MNRIYELSNQVVLGTEVAHNPLLHRWFTRIVQSSGFTGIQHMPVRLAPGLALSDAYMELITSLHQAWRGPFRSSRSKVLALKAMPLIPRTTASISTLEMIQKSRTSPLPCILYPESDQQSLTDFGILIKNLRGDRVVQAEDKHFVWFEIDRNNPGLLQDFYQQQGWYNCIDLIHFTRNMPGFGIMLLAMQEVSTHVHVRCGKDQQGTVAAATSAKQLLDGTSSHYEQLRMIATACAIQHVTIELPLSAIIDATGVSHPSEAAITRHYATVLGHVRKAFGD